MSNDRFGATSAGYYQRLDPLNRIQHDIWTKGRNLYEVELAYDESGNITLQEDKLQRNWGGSGDPGVYDAAYTMDDRNRLVRTTEGDWGTSSFNSVARREVWSNAGATADALSQTGNWDRHRLDLNGDNNFTGTGELDDTRTYNAVNELLTRDTDSTSGTTGNNYTTAYDAVGNLIDDGKDYLYVYDVFGRLKTIKKRSNSAVVAEYTYNGLNMRTGWHYDADGDGDVDSSDPWYHFAYDEKWRLIATFLGSDTSSKELFAYHNAGMNGQGGSSYIDSVILRDKDANTAWTSSSDGTCEERVYYVQNWRADASAILSDAGIVKEWIKYSSYGVPIRIDPADYNRDGYVNGNDYDDFADDFDNMVDSADVNFDNYVNGDDYDLFAEWWENPSSAGRYVLSAPSIGNRIGYAGYQHESAVAGVGRAVYHVRYRTFDAGLGVWMRRDPLDYWDDVTLFGYGKGNPIVRTDSNGLLSLPCGGRCGGDSQPASDPGKPQTPIFDPTGTPDEDVEKYRSECEAACKANPNASALGWCVNGKSIICVCNKTPHNPKPADNRPRTPDFREGYRKCQEEYERRQWEDDSPVHWPCPEGFTGDPNADKSAHTDIERMDRLCRKAKLLDTFADCISKISCTDDICKKEVCLFSEAKRCQAKGLKEFCNPDGRSMADVDARSQQIQKDCARKINEKCK
ncbi:MAG: RHS repeat-associated core domain-containing protein [Phycisphaerales bacterium]